MGVCLSPQGSIICMWDCWTLIWLVYACIWASSTRPLVHCIALLASCLQDPRWTLLLRSSSPLLLCSSFQLFFSNSFVWSSDSIIRVGEDFDEHLWVKIARERKARVETQRGIALSEWTKVSLSFCFLFFFWLLGHAFGCEGGQACLLSFPLAHERARKGPTVRENWIRKWAVKAARQHVCRGQPDSSRTQRCWQTRVLAAHWSHTPRRCSQP